MKIGVFGGSFNPPHKMHLDIALNLIKKGYVDKVIFVPTGNKYEYKNDMADSNHRLNMLKLMSSNYDTISVDDYELKDNVVYTYQTLEKIQNENPNAEIYFICGLDNLSYMDKWYRGLDYFKNYKVIVINRQGNDIIEVLNKFKDYQQNIIEFPMPMSDLSSSMIRRKIMNNEDIKEYVTEEVFNYIVDNNLYTRREYENI